MKLLNIYIYYDTINCSIHSDMTNSNVKEDINENDNDETDNRTIIIDITLGHHDSANINDDAD